MKWLDFASTRSVSSGSERANRQQIYHNTDISLAFDTHGTECVYRVHCILTDGAEVRQDAA